MTNEDLAGFRMELDELSRRVDARMWEFGQKGEFSDVHRTSMDQIRQRHDLLKSKVNAAARDGTRWDLVKAELARDYSSIFDSLRQLEERLDADAMKKKS